uniref:C2H2-type domain-containing protein n=1 Tax=Rhodosorus marinus TaxID=101924 RepID=A0A7S2ZU81_9RHOD|mmetsp:Transcript_31918/g.123855  ORF Transcript_31918/g.123855 Transcript_31918/m.123855 type:complete len:444 (+) Transcript_31918:130-1461(+)
MDGQSVGKDVYSLCEYLGWDSVPLNWILFRFHRQEVPEPENRKAMLLDMKIRIPEATKAVIGSSEVASMVSVLNQPSLMMSEFQGREFTLGSGWAFLGGLPGIKSECKGLKRIRFLSYFKQRKAVTLLSCEVRPGLITFVKVAEVSGRFNFSQWGFIDKLSEVILHTQSHIDTRACDMCVLAGVTCDPTSCPSVQTFDDLRDRRLALFQEEHRPGFSMHYTKPWLSGTYTIPVGPLEPITSTTTVYLSGQNFDLAFLSVLQFEVEGVNPPRSSFRFVKNEMDDMQGSLGLEELTSSETTLTKSCAVVVSMGESTDMKTNISSTRKRESTCETCGQAFTRAHNLKRHRLLVHQKRRDFVCEYCQRTFTQNGHLKEHIKVNHVGTNLFSCTVCGKGFGARSKLQRHVLTVHENRRSYKCDVCEKKYKEKSYLKRHMQKQHGAELD